MSSGEQGSGALLCREIPEQDNKTSSKARKKTAGLLLTSAGGVQ